MIGKKTLFEDLLREKPSKCHLVPVKWQQPLFSTTLCVRLSFEANGRARERRHGARSGLSKRNRLRSSQFVSAYVGCEQRHAFDISSDTYWRMPCTYLVQNTSGLLILFVPNTCRCSRCWNLAIHCSETPFDMCIRFHFGQATPPTLPCLQVLEFWADELHTHTYGSSAVENKNYFISRVLSEILRVSLADDPAKVCLHLSKKVLGLVNFWRFLYTFCTIEVP